jgi:putative DNA methylase
MDDEPLDLRDAIAAEWRPGVHPWFAARRPAVARTAVALTVDRTARASEGGARNAVRRAPEGRTADPAERIRLLDVFAGISAIAGAAAGMGHHADAVELNPVAHLVARVMWVHGADHGRPVGTWRGLAAEYSAVAGELWAEAEGRFGGCFDEKVRAYLWIRATSCSRCGEDVDLAHVSDAAAIIEHPDEPVGRRGQVECPRCGAVTRIGVEGYRSARVDLRGVVTHDNTVLEEVTDPGWGGASAPPEVWSADVELGTARQAAVMSVLVDSVRGLNARLVAQGVEPARRRALIECAALQVSAVSEYARGHGRLDRNGRFTSGGRLGMRTQRAFAEPGIALWQSAWQRRLAAFTEAIGAAAELPGTVTPHAANASQLPFDDSSFDAVIADPPYFDNIHYADESEPYYRWLRMMLGATYPLESPDPPSSGEVTLKRDGDNTASLDRYDALLRGSMAEAARVLRPKCVLSVLCNPRDPEGLDDFLRRVAPEGLELAEVIPIRTQVAPVDNKSAEWLTYVLLFRKSLAVRPSGPATVDATRVLELADAGKPHLFGAIAAILDDAWDDEDLGRIPDDHEGSRLQKITEYAAGVTDPVELLSEVGPQVLRRHADVLGLAKGHRPPDTTGLAMAILKLVGFTVPTTPSFTFHPQLANAERAAETLPLSHDEEELQGRFKTGAAAIEQAIHLAARAWVTVAQPAAVDDTFEALFRQARDEKPFRGFGKFTFGDWVAVFSKLTPEVLTHPPAPLLHAGLARLRRTLTKGKVQQYLDTHVGCRNTIEHPDDAYRRLSFDAKVTHAVEGMRAGVEALRRLLDSQTLPQVIQPIEERRDPWGRRTLHVLDERQVRREFYVATETDLTRPYLWFPSGSNPREVAPLLVDFDQIA